MLHIVLTTTTICTTLTAFFSLIENNVWTYRVVALGSTIVMFVVATLAAILDLQTSFAIETSPLLLFEGRNVHASTRKSRPTLLCELNTVMELLPFLYFCIFHVRGGHIGSHLGFPYILCH